MNASVLLREARAAAHLSQRELARITGVAQPVISRIERGQASPRLDTLDRLLRACGKELDLVDRRGRGVDVTLNDQRLRLTPGERGRLTAKEWNATRAFRRGRRRR